MGHRDFTANFTTWTLGGVAVLLYLIYDYWNQTLLKRRGIPGPTPYPIVGNLLNFREGFALGAHNARKKYGKVFGLSFFGYHQIFISDPDMAQEIMISRFSVFPNRIPMGVKDRPLNDAIFNVRDDRWREVRSTLSPAFSGSKMKQMTHIINESCDQLLEHFEQLRKEGPSIQCKDIYGSYTMDVIASTFFGLKIDSHKNPNDPFVKHAKAVFDLSVFNPRVLLIVLFPWLCPLLDRLNIGFTAGYIKDFFQRVVRETISSRESSSTKRMDMLQLMLDAHNLESEEREESSSKKKALTTEEIMANSLIFFLAGYETTNIGLCYTSYLLATNPEAQTRLIEEVDKFAPTRNDVTYDTVKEMEYLDALVRESLRLFPPVAIIQRDNDKTNIINGIEIPKGVTIIFPVYAMHHDPDIWEDPEQFRPERFFKENRDKIHPIGWLPFGAGPRSCIGLRLAFMEIKFGLIRLLQKYRFITCADTEIPPVFGNSGMGIRGTKLQITPRETVNQ